MAVVGKPTKDIAPEGALSRRSKGPAEHGDVPRPAVPDWGATLVKAGGRPAAAQAFDREVVSFFVDAAEILGVPKSVAAIYGICFATLEPLSFADIATRLDISQGSISQGLRVLKDVGALKIVGTHERREYFAPELEMRKLGERFIEERLEKQLYAGRRRLDAMVAAVPEDGSAASAELQARLKYLLAWHDKTKALVPLVKTVLKLG